MSSNANHVPKPKSKSKLSETVFQSLRNFGQEVCGHCHGSGCRDCAWFGTEEARESYERAKKVVSGIRRNRIEAHCQVRLSI